GEYAAKYAKENAAPEVHADEVDAAARAALAPFERGAAGGDGEGPYKIQYALQKVMQDNVGIVRNQVDMREALIAIGELKERADKVAVVGNREYNPGWHTALDLQNLLTVSEVITMSALERTESRGGHFREDHPDKDPAQSKFNLVVAKGADGRPHLRRQSIAEVTAELKQIIEENK